MIRELLWLFTLRAWLADGHRGLASGTTCSTQFTTADAPLPIPNAKISWAAYRIATCDAPIFWLEADAESGQDLEFTLGVPLIERFSDTVLSAALIGPGLPTADQLSGEEMARVPEAVLDSLREGEGIKLFETPADQTSCAHLRSAEMTAATSVEDDRCVFHEEWAGSESWVLIDEKYTTVAEGTFRFAAYESNNQASKFWFACCAWPEDFLTEYDLPSNECDVCGTVGTHSMDMLPHEMYYEHNDYAQYGGYPPNQNCDLDSSRPVPKKSQCPPDAHTDDDGPPKWYTDMMGGGDGRPGSNDSQDHDHDHEHGAGGDHDHDHDHDTSGGDGGFDWKQFLPGAGGGDEDSHDHDHDNDHDHDHDGTDHDSHDDDHDHDHDHDHDGADHEHDSHDSHDSDDHDHDHDHDHGDQSEESGEGGTRADMMDLCAAVAANGSCEENCQYAFSDKDLSLLIPDSLTMEICTGEAGSYMELCPDECEEKDFWADVYDGTALSYQTYCAVWGANNKANCKACGGRYHNRRGDCYIQKKVNKIKCKKMSSDICQHVGCRFKGGKCQGRPKFS